MVDDLIAGSERRRYGAVMPSLPDSEIYLLVRTFFGDDAGWDELTAIVAEETDEGFVATVQVVDDVQFDGYSPAELEVAHPHRNDGWDVLYIADELAVTQPAHPLLLIRVGNSEDRPFRCRADRLHEVDANLSLANLDWDDFRDQVDESGVYGGLEMTGVATDQRPTMPEVAAHAAASSEPITIAVPAQLWSAMVMDLQTAPTDSLGDTNHKQIAAIATRLMESIWDDRTVAPRMGLDDDVIVTFAARDWAFIRERARRLGRYYGLMLDGDSYGDAVPAIVELLSRDPL